MNIKERAEMVKAMETLARAVNNENIFELWLVDGVADGDITPNTTDEELESYCEDERFSELMETFLILMSRARKDGGLYCDRVCSE